MTGFITCTHIYHRCDLCFNSKQQVLQLGMDISHDRYILSWRCTNAFGGIIGEYVRKIYIETKNRPKYFVDESVLR